MAYNKQYTKRKTIRIPAEMLEKAEKSGNVSLYFRKCSYFFEKSNQSQFTLEYEIEIRRLKRLIKMINLKEKSGGLTLEEAKFVDELQSHLLKLMQHNWFKKIIF